MAPACLTVSAPPSGGVMTRPFLTYDQQGRGIDEHARRMAWEAKAAADALRPSVGGPVAVGALTPAQPRQVVVSFAPEIRGAFVPVPVLHGGAGLLASLSVAGVVATTSTSVTVLVRASGVVSAGATVTVVCHPIF